MVTSARRFTRRKIPHVSSLQEFNIDLRTNNGSEGILIRKQISVIFGRYSITIWRIEVYSPNFCILNPPRLPQQFSCAVVAGSRHFINRLCVCLRYLCIRHRKALTAQVTLCGVFCLAEQSNGRAGYIAVMLTIITFAAEISRQTHGNQFAETTNVIAENL